MAAPTGGHILVIANSAKTIILTFDALPYVRIWKLRVIEFAIAGYLGW